MEKSGFRATMVVAALASSMLMGQPLPAQDSEADTDQAKPDPHPDITAKTKRAAARAKQYAEEEKEFEAKVARDKARLDALGLPSFEGKTTLKEGAGALEGVMLSSYAVGDAATKIATGLNGTYLVVAGAEAIDFAPAAALKSEMEALKVALQLAIHTGGQTLAAEGKAASDDDEERNDPTMLFAAISAAAGLLRSDVEVSALEASAISDRMLATAVAAKLGSKAILPGAAVASSPAEAANSPLIRHFQDLANLRLQAESVRAELDPEKKAHKRAVAALDAQTKRYDDFYTRVTTPDDKAVIPIANAVRLEQLLGTDRKVLRVYVDKAGGSMLNIKNIATTFGADPVRASGGLLASYTVTNPMDGRVEAAGLLTCRTALANLREVQNGMWRTRKSNKVPTIQDHCEEISRSASLASGASN